MNNFGGVRDHIKILLYYFPSFLFLFSKTRTHSQADLMEKKQHMCQFMVLNINQNFGYFSSYMISDKEKIIQKSYKKINISDLI